MSNWKTFKHEYNGIKFMSEGEVKFYQELEASGLDFKYQPEPIQIMPAFTSPTGKKYQAIKYEADFAIYINKTIFYIEVKGQNDLLYTYIKGQKPRIKDNSELYRLRHKLFDQIIQAQGNVFMLIRDNQLKTPEYAGMFWEQDLMQMRKYKTQGRKDLCADVPRAMQRIKQFITNMENCYADKLTCENRSCGVCSIEYGQTIIDFGKMHD